VAWCDPPTEPDELGLLDGELRPDHWSLPLDEPEELEELEESEELEELDEPEEPDPLSEPPEPPVPLDELPLWPEYAAAAVADSTPVRASPPASAHRVTRETLRSPRARALIASSRIPPLLSWLLAVCARQVGPARVSAETPLGTYVPFWVRFTAGTQPDHRGFPDRPATLVVARGVGAGSWPGRPVGERADQARRPLGRLTRE
jgi:hypothetical protein